eukprot:TRINITY_DN21856_c0_g1_i1.p1 TRINITY_DN21856_c0_g1~~TRINITY_DN21856_c0_g1_i1.p1  ORF type:complete len:298 (+),score=42.50 TRINITY_DN21856_c0_g1_i1:90-983(+)
MRRPTSLFSSYLSHFTKTYYLLHYIAFAAYAYVRWNLTEMDRTPEQEQWLGELVGPDMSGMSREVQIWGCYIMILITRAMRFESVTELISSAIGFAKPVICISLFIVDWYLPAYFAMTWIVLFFVTSEPSFETPNRRFVKLDATKMFDVVFTAADKEKERSQVYWFVNVWASWQGGGASKKFNPVFAELSSEYTNDFCKFTKIDAGRVNSQPIIKKLAIDDGAFSKHMPSMILYKNGTEIARLPQKGKKNASRLHQYSKEQIIRFFEMERIKEETMKKTSTRRTALRQQAAEAKKTK